MRTNLLNSAFPFVLVFLFMSLFLPLSAQELDFEEPPEELRDYKVRPVRLGIKIGFPNLVGGNLEFVTPLFNDKLSISVDYSTIKSAWFLEDSQYTNTETDELNFSYLNAGLNYYFFKSGKGLYGGVGYGQINLKGKTAVMDDGEEGTGTIDFGRSSFNVRLGAKLGGLFYFRPEVGYAFTPLPKSIEYQVKYPNGRTEEDVYDFSEHISSAEFLFQGFIANIGFGFAF